MKCGVYILYESPYWTIVLTDQGPWSSAIG